METIIRAEVIYFPPRKGEDIAPNARVIYRNVLTGRFVSASEFFEDEDEDVTRHDFHFIPIEEVAEPEAEQELEAEPEPRVGAISQDDWDRLWLCRIRRHERELDELDAHYATAVMLHAEPKRRKRIGRFVGQSVFAW